MKIAAWYTKDTVYEDIFHEMLEPTLKEYSLDSLIIPMPNHKKWGMNVAQKPLVILDTLNKLKEPFVLLDVDCKITSNPTLFNDIDTTKYDIAFHTLNWGEWYNRSQDIRKEVLTGTMWFNYNENVIKMVEAWYQHCAVNPGADQPPLEKLMNSKYKHLRVFDLPIGYCYITSMPNGKKPFVKVNKPVISHYQASRIYKRGEL